MIRLSDMHPRWWLALGAANGALVVVLGAYGAHALKDPERLSLLQTALPYHMFHTLALLIVGVMAMTHPRSAWWAWVGGLLLAGIVLFCGGLYVGAIIGYRGLTTLTPFGGIAFIGAWVLFAIAILRRR